MHKRPTVRALFFLALWLPAMAWPAVEAGRVMMISGIGTATSDDGEVRKLAKNDPIYSGDLINSGPGAYVNLRFADGAFFLLRPDTRFEVEDYSYQEPANAEPTADKPAASPTASSTPATPLVTAASQSNGVASRAFFRLVKGGFRAVSGLIGKVNHDDYRVATPVATIGIRGTRYTARLCLGDCVDRSEITSALRGRGGNVGNNTPILITTVESGSIALGTGLKTDIQLPGTTRFVVGEAGGSDGDGAIVPGDRPPEIERSEEELSADACVP